MFSKYPPWVTIKSITRKKIMMPPNPSPSKTQIFKKKKKGKTLFWFLNFAKSLFFIPKL